MTNNKFKSFEELKTWQLARSFKNKIYLISNIFPKHELYGLTSQIRRSAISITANIAEGYGRFNYQENIQFCRMARGSLLETLDHLYIALDQKYISQENFDQLYNLSRETEKCLNGYIKYLQNQK